MGVNVPVRVSSAAADQLPLEMTAVEEDACNLVAVQVVSTWLTVSTEQHTAASQTLQRETGHVLWRENTQVEKVQEKSWITLRTAWWGLCKGS